MGDRTVKPTQPFDSNDLVELTKKPIVGAGPEDGAGDDDPLADWDEVTPVIAAGSQSNALPTTSRTATLHDPLTTGLLAEVARRTLEADPATAARPVRNTQEIDPELLARALREAEAPAAEPVHAHTKRRPK